MCILSIFHTISLPFFYLPITLYFYIRYSGCTNNTTINNLCLMRKINHVLNMHCVGNAQNLIDIIYIIGSNGNKAQEIFNKEKDIIKEMLESGSTANTKYSIIQYDNEPQIKARFSDLSNPESVKHLLDRLQWEDEGESIGESLEVAAELFKSDSRRDSKKVIVAFVGETVEHTNQKLKDTVDRLAEDGVRIIPVVVSSSPDPSMFDGLKPNVQNPITGKIDEDPSRTADKVGKETFTGNFEIIFVGENICGRRLSLVHVYILDPCFASECDEMSVCRNGKCGKLNLFTQLIFVS